MPAKIQQLANILNNPTEINLQFQACRQIIQAAMFTENQKLGIIRNLFMDEVPERVILASSKIKVVKWQKLEINEAEWQRNALRILNKANDS